MKNQTIITILLILGILISFGIPIASADVTDGLMAYYPFDGNANDQSGNDNHGTEYGDLKYKSGIRGDSASLDGIDDFIRVPSSPSLNPADQLSISFWMKVEGITNLWSPIIHKGGPRLSGYKNREYSVWLKNDTSVLLASAGNGSSQRYYYANSARIDAWSHYVGIIDRQNHKIKVYVDGILSVETDDSYSTFNSNDHDLIIGWSEETHSSHSPFMGRIDEVRIYDRILTEDEVKALYDEHFGQPVKTIGIWENFPDNQGDGGFFAYGYAAATDTYWLLSDAGSYSFYRPEESRWHNPNLRKSIRSYIFLNPSGTLRNTGSPEDAVVAWVVPETAFYILNGTFSIHGASWNGIDAYVKANNKMLWSSYLAPGTGRAFEVTSFLLNAGDTVYFGVGAHNAGSFSEANDWAYLKGQIIRISSPALFGDTIGISPNYAFSLEQSTQQEFSISLTNLTNSVRSASLEIINPHSDLTVSPGLQNPITIEPEEIRDIPILINSGNAPVGIYDDLILKLAVDDGETLCSDISVTITEQGAGNLPDLSIRSEDIRLADYVLGESATLTAVIHNRGLSSASDVQVKFYEFGNLIGETVIAEVPSGGIGETSVTFPITTSGEHLIRVVIDSSEMIQELDEANNEASKIIQLASEAPIQGNILVTGSLPSRVYTDSLFTLSGRAVYDIYVDGIRYTDYVVKGGLVQVTIRSSEGAEWVYGGVHTNVNGYFSKSLIAPSAPGNYQILMTVTDNTFIGKRELTFAVTERPATPPPPPIPPCTDCAGIWTYSDTTWIWTWSSPPANGPLLMSDLRVYSENIHFSNTNPAMNEEITIFAEILYWATRTDLIAEAVPVNFYVTYPGTPKMKIGQTLISSISVGAPDFGLRYVYTTWKNHQEGVYIVEAEIDPGYPENNHLNNAATRAIIVGQIQGYAGVVSGQVTDPLGGVANVPIALSDSNGSPVSQTLTNDTGYYLFEGVPPDEYLLHITTPDGYMADAETKTATVSDQTLTETDFHLNYGTQEFCCDLDGDNDCDMNDYDLFINAYGKSPNDQGYTDKADYDEDHIISLTDFQQWYQCYWDYQG